MEKLISCCGINCAECDARIATIKNDDKLRAETAEKWKTLYNAPSIPLEAINCTGCLEPGVKIAHCKECEIKNCANAKNFTTCAECDMLESCDKLNKVLLHMPDALGNLKSLQ